MRNNQKRLPSGTKGQVERPLRDQDRIDSALETMCRRLNKVMTAERITLWHEDLINFPVEGIEYAFDCWSRNAKALPVLADIAGLLATWLIPEVKKKVRDVPGCDLCQMGYIVVNPEAKQCDWKMRPCECLHDPSLRPTRDPHPLTAQERIELKQRLDAFTAIQPKRFPNGNPRYNRPLVQARVLGAI